MSLWGCIGAQQSRIETRDLCLNSATVKMNNLSLLEDQLITNRMLYNPSFPFPGNA